MNPIQREAAHYFRSFSFSLWNNEVICGLRWVNCHFFTSTSVYFRLFFSKRPLTEKQISFPQCQSKHWKKNMNKFIAQQENGRRRRSISRLQHLLRQSSSWYFSPHLFHNTSNLLLLKQERKQVKGAQYTGCTKNRIGSACCWWC